MKSLERDRAEGFPQIIDFVLTPFDETTGESFPEKLFEEVVDPLLAVGHQIDASLPDLSLLPPSNNDSPIQNLEQVRFLCDSAAFRNREAVLAGRLPVNLTTCTSSTIGTISGAINALSGRKVALLLIDSALRLDLTTEESVEASQITLSALTSNISEFSDLAVNPLLDPLNILHLGLSEPSSIKPKFRYYSAEVVQEYSLTAVLSEFTEILNEYSTVYVSWNTSSLAGFDNLFAAFNLREANQIANWIDGNLRRKNKLLGIDFANLKSDFGKDQKEILKSLILRVLGKTLFN